jgi:hypothetical protein
MALKNIWKNKIDGVDDVLAEDINNIAESVIELERKAEEKPKIEVDQDYNPLSENPQSGKAVAKAISSKADIEYVNNNFANALKGEKSEKNVLRVDDFSMIPHNVDFQISPYNLINQEEFFSTNSYPLSVEVGKTYIISGTLKPDADVTSTSGLFIYDSSGQLVLNQNIVTSLEYHFTVEEGYQYVWETLGVNVSDIFDSVEMLIDVDSVNVLTYEKNLFNFVKTSAFNYNLPIYPLGTVLTVSIARTPLSGVVQFQKSTDGVNYTRIGYLGTSEYNKAITFTVEQGGLYRVLFNDKSLLATESVQVELGKTETSHVPYVEPLVGFEILYPTSTYIADAEGVNISVNYNRDIIKIIERLEKAVALN